MVRKKGSIGAPRSATSGALHEMMYLGSFASGIKGSIGAP